MWHWLTEHIDFILLYIVVKFLAYELVDYINLDLCAYLTLDHTHWSLSWTEAWNIGLLTILFELCVYILLIVSLFDDKCQHAANLVGIFKCNIHFLFLSYCCYEIYVFSGTMRLIGCKGTNNLADYQTTKEILTI